MFAGPQTSPPSTLTGRNIARRQHLERDCRQRLESVGNALDHLERHRPEGIPVGTWIQSLGGLKDSRTEVMISLDQATEEFANSNSRGVMQLLAQIKRLEGRLTNFCARYEVRLP